MPDTLPEAQAVVTEVRRRLDPATRVLQVLELSEALRLQALARLRAADPAASEAELVRRLVRERFEIALPPPNR